MFSSVRTCGLVNSALTELRIICYMIDATLVTSIGYDFRRITSDV